MNIFMFISSPSSVSVAIPFHSYTFGYKFIAGWQAGAVVGTLPSDIHLCSG